MQEFDPKPAIPFRPIPDPTTTIRGDCETLVARFGLTFLTQDVVQSAVEVTHKHFLSKTGYPYAGDQIDKVFFCREFLKVLCNGPLAQEIDRVLNDTANDEKLLKSMQQEVSFYLDAMMSQNFMRPLLWDFKVSPNEERDISVLRLAFTVMAMLTQEEEANRAGQTLHDAIQDAERLANGDE